MDEVIKQSPENIDKATIEAIFAKNNENVLDTLLELWDFDDKKTDNVINSSVVYGGVSNDSNDSNDSNVSNDDVLKDKKKWANIRDICDSFDKEMDVFMKNNIKQK
jgi:hypothetical protein